MQRREFSAGVCASAVGGLIWSTVAQAQAKAPKEGVEYLKLTRPAPVDAPAGKVEVVEFFGYWCPHCAKFEPAFDAWVHKVPSHIAVKRVPVAFRPDQEPLQRLYFVLEAMGKVDELHGKVFTTIHGDRQRLGSADDVANWAAKHGVDKTKFMEFYNSFSMAGKVKRANQYAAEYALDGVPAMGVAGRYFTSGTQAGSMERVLSVVEYLAEEVRKG